MSWLTLVFPAVNGNMMSLPLPGIHLVFFVLFLAAKAKSLSSRFAENLLTQLPANLFQKKVIWSPHLIWSPLTMLDRESSRENITFRASSLESQELHRIPQDHIHLPSIRR